ncbi:hypothetical protein JYB62_01825 [Algoriphagus lutimaris]|uniref:hypothetical protein n=1 Tax=Algoriphagus lutimaris TaxID=613197 RepID=UPI00196AE3C5|nr:hypothetical protein [Algoriphagus lutimaris]MBN3518726.1 hypothetical protein [Algoriphagus lutimaris]
MDRKGLIIWIAGMAVLGLMAAFLFNQAKSNRVELDNQASRNILMLRDALLKSTDDLRAEIRSFEWFTFALFDEDSPQKNAAISQDRPTDKFKFSVDTLTDIEISFADSVLISKIPLQDYWPEEEGAAWFNKLLNAKEPVSFKSIYNVPEQKEGDRTFLSTKVSYQSWLREMGKKNLFFDELAFIQEDGEVLYPDRLKGINFITDLGKNSGDSINSSSTKIEISLYSVPYYGYKVPLVQGATKIWVLGLKEQADLEQAAYKIDFTILIILILVLVILLSVLPIISFLSMGKGDVLTQGRVISMGISLLMFMLVAGWTCSYLFHLNHPVKDEQPRLEQIKTKLSEKLNSSFEQLDYETILTDNVNEIFLAKLINNDTFPQAGKLTYIKTKNYESGIGIRDFSFISVSHRNYFKYHTTTKKPEGPYFIERIFSQQNGEPEQVISTTRKNEIKGISFRLDDIPFDEERRFLLVKKNGGVVHASSKFEIQFTQLQSVLEKERWSNLETIFSYDKVDYEGNWVLPIRINGQEYKALISPLVLNEANQTLFFIYLINLNNYHLMSGLASLESFIFLIIYLILLTTLFSLTTFFTKKTYNWKKFLFWWILYRDHKAINFRNAGISLLIIFSSWFIYSLLEIDSLFDILISVFLVVISSIIIVGGLLYFGRKNPDYTEPKIYSFFILIWFLGLGFIPGFSICNAVFKMEDQIWEKSIDTKEIKNDSTSISWYQGSRAILFSNTVTAQDKQIARFIEPHPSVFNSAINPNDKKDDKDDKNQQESDKETQNWFLVFLFLSILPLIWYGINFLVSKLLWLNFDVREENALGSIIQSELNLCNNLRLFLCGCDSNVSRFWIYSQFKLKEDELLIVDCADSGLKIPTAEDLKGKQALLIEDIHTLESMDDFMNSLSKIHDLTNSIHLVLSSGSNWKTLVNKLSSELSQVRFSELMNGYYFEFVPLKPQNNSIPVHNQNIFNEEEVERYFYKRGLLSKNNEDPNARLLLQRYGKAFYFNIWSELTIEEKNVCYGYAIEGFLNYKNYDEVIELFQKGVLTKSELAGNLQLFSKTFRYFIIANISTEMVSKLKEYRKKNSNVGNVQWGVFSFLIIAIGLIAYFERSFFTEIQALITGILGLVSFVVSEIKRFFTLKSQ